LKIFTLAEEFGPDQLIHTCTGEHWRAVRIGFDTASSVLNISQCG
jgi:hypothetical protein